MKFVEVGLGVAAVLGDSNDGEDGVRGRGESGAGKSPRSKSRWGWRSGIGGSDSVEGGMAMKFGRVGDLLGLRSGIDGAEVVKTVSSKFVCSVPIMS